MILNYTPKDDEVAVGDANVEADFKQILGMHQKFPRLHVRISQDLMLLRFRVAVREGDIQPFTVRHKNGWYRVNPDGTMNSDFWKAVDMPYDNLLFRLLG